MAGYLLGLNCFKASLQETRAALQQMQQTLRVIHEARADDRAILDQLSEHLMGPLDVRDYGIHSSSFSHGRGSPSAHGSLSMRGSPSTRGTSCKHLQSQLLGDDPACRYRSNCHYCHCYRMFILLDCCFHFRLSPLRRWQFWDVFRYSLSPAFTGWQFCLVYIYDYLCLLVC